MVGIRRVKLLVGVFIPILAIFLMSHNTFAYEFYSNFNITAFSYKSDSSSNPVITLNSINNNASTPYVNDAFAGSFHTIIAPRFTLNKVANLSKTRRLLLRFEIFTQTTRNDSIAYVNTGFQCPYGLGDIKVANCKVMTSDYETIMERTSLNNPGQGEELTVSITSNKTYIVELEIYNNSELPVPITEIALAGRPLSVSLSSNANSISTGFSWQFTWITASAFYYENPDQEAADAIKEQNAKENAAVDNIDNQSANDMSGSSDQQTTSIIGTISSFVGAFSNVQASANCNLTLPFPEFLGGNTMVNICQGKEKAPALIAIGSSLLLIVTFVPLAFIMLRMIYSEIRSFTNG